MESKGGTKEPTKRITVLNESTPLLRGCLYIKVFVKELMTSKISHKNRYDTHYANIAIVEAPV